VAKQMSVWDRVLLRAFVERELHDFSSFRQRTNHDQVARIEKVLADIEKDLSTRDDYWTIHFESMSNLGYTLRSLSLAGFGASRERTLQCIFDKAIPGRFVVQSPDATGIKDMSELFPGRGE
jgi:hypothetical protein